MVGICILMQLIVYAISLACVVGLSSLSLPMRVFIGVMLIFTLDAVLLLIFWMWILRLEERENNAYPDSEWSNLA